MEKYKPSAFYSGLKIAITNKKTGGYLMESKILKPYKGFTIEKSWDELAGIKINIVYTAYKGRG